MGKVAKLLAVCLAIAMAMTVLAGCKQGYEEENIESSELRELGDTVTVEFSYNLLSIYQTGPYELEVTPEAIETLTVENGKMMDCVRVRIKVLSTHNGEDPKYENCVHSIQLLSRYLHALDTNIWYVDKQGTEADAFGTLELNKDYTFWIPVRKQPAAAANMTYITVFSQAGYYKRIGPLYLYPVEEEVLAVAEARGDWEPEESEETSSEAADSASASADASASASASASA